MFLEHHLRAEFPNLNLRCNTSDPVGIELDFYFPDLQLAIELNGIVHYEPIYGREKLERVQNIDRLKAARCLEAGISLFIIDVSREPYLTHNIKDRHWTTVKELVTSMQRHAGHTNVQVP